MERGIVERCLGKNPGRQGAEQALELMKRVLGKHFAERGRQFDALASGLLRSWSCSVAELQQQLEQLRPDEVLGESLSRLLRQLEQSARAVFSLDGCPGDFEMVLEVVQRDMAAEAASPRRRAVEAQPPFVVDNGGELRVPHHPAPKRRAVGVMDLEAYRASEGQ